MLDLVRNFVESHYPIGPGEKVLGRSCKARKVHSVMTASRQYGIQYLRLRHLFQGMTTSDSFTQLPPPNSREQVPAKVYDPWLKRYAETINPKSAARLLGVKYEVFIKLRDAGWVKPFVSVEGTVDRYDADELQRLLDHVFQNATPVADLEADQISFLASPMHCRCDSLDVLRLVCEGQLRTVLRRVGKSGLSGLCISKMEVLDALEGPPLNGFTKEQLRWKWRVSSSTVTYLVNSGFVSARRTRHPRNRKFLSLVHKDEVQRFEKKYKTLGCLSAEHEMQPIKLAAKLTDLKVKPINLPKGLSRVYRRSDIDGVL
ncbi:hypothetical protein [Roseobacter sinensis]|uniref:hypothetical protein n=1 Tax=Roseobacter sinensis TaxID=2931391 RepID=UPI0021E84066|nr:hypothetical protein [Roseobacter sp. WL0113]